VHKENATMPCRTVNMNGIRRSLNVTGEFKSPDQIGNIIINSINGSPVYLKDIAEVVDSHKEQESFARLDHKNVITLSIVKRKGENLINRSEERRVGK